MKSVINTVFVAAFAVLISGIGVSTLLGYKTQDLQRFIDFEMRYPAPGPDWTWQPEQIKTYFPKLDLYINDGFPFRDVLIQIYGYFNKKIQVSLNPENEVIGKNGFIFLGNFHHKVLDQITGKDLMSDAELKAWTYSFVEIKKYLDQQNIPMYIAVCPVKHSVYPEYLPNYITPSKKNRTQQIIDSKPDLNIINIKNVMLNAKAVWGDHLYYKTDSHWTEIGAYQGFMEIMKHLMPDFEELTLSPNDNTKFMIKPFGETVGLYNVFKYNILKQEDSLVEIAENSDWNTNLVKTDFQGDTLLFDTYPYNIYLNQSVILNNKKPYTILILGDSFSALLSPFLNQAFGKVIYCYYSQLDGIKLTRLVEKFKPDLVLYEFVERIFTQIQEVDPSIILKAEQDKLTSIAKMDGDFLFKYVSNTSGISNKKLEDGDFTFEVTNNDPQFNIPGVSLSAKSDIFIKVDLIVPGETIAEIFYLSGGLSAYDENHKSSTTAFKGMNELLFVINEHGINGRLIRFDPGGVVGKYTIHSIEFFEKKSESDKSEL